MRVSVLLPTTGSLNRVLSVVSWAGRDLSASQVEHTLHWMPLDISGDYHALTRRGGLLWELGSPFQHGVYQLKLVSPVESGKSWELPVILAHLVVDLGEELAESPAKADVVLWSTGMVAGKVDGKHGIGNADYRLRTKAERSRDELQDAVKAGARIVALVPACEDAAPLRDLLNRIGARSVVETVTSVEDACVIVQRELGNTVLEVVSPELVSADAPANPPPANSNPVGSFQTPGRPPRAAPHLVNGAKPGVNRNWKMRALLAAVTVTLAALIVRSDVILQLIGPDTIRGALKGRDAAAVDVSGDQAQSALQPQPPAAPAAAGRDQPVAASQDSSKPPVAPGLADPREGQDIPPQAAAASPAAGASQVPAAAPQASTPAAVLPPVPVKLRELRAANDGSCIPFIIERRTPPRTIDVTLDSPDRFHDSAGRNLCILEWTVNPDAKGVQGFDIDRPRVPGAQLSGTGLPGAWTRVRIEFTRDFTNTSPATYTVRLKFNGAPPQDEVQQFRHTIR
jgi:hypothetical protein